MYETILDVSSDPLAVAVVFFVALGLFHLVFVYLRPLSLAQWRLMDYIWITLALGSVAGFVEEARYYRSDVASARLEANLVSAQKDIEHWFDVYARFSCEDGQANDTCDWFTQKEADLTFITGNEPFPADLPTSLIDGLESAAPTYSPAEFQRIKGFLSAYQDGRTQFLGALHDGERSAFFRLLTALAPLIFAVAVALRFTKTTGEYLQMRRN